MYLTVIIKSKETTTVKANLIASFFLSEIKRYEKKIVLIIKTNSLLPKADTFPFRFTNHSGP